jgi:hypothetical protein
VVRRSRWSITTSGAPRHESLLSSSGDSQTSTVLSKTKIFTNHLIWLFSSAF